MKLRSTTLLVAFIACGTAAAVACTGDDPEPASAPSDAGSDTGEQGDAGVETPDAGPCDLTGPFQTPRLLPAIPRAGITLSNDELTAYWGDEPISDGGLDGSTIVFAVRLGVSSDFGAPLHLFEPPEIGAYEYFPRLSSDGKAIFFAHRVGPPGPAGTMMVARRASTADSFGTLKPVSGLDRIGTDTVVWFNLAGADGVWLSTQSGQIYRGRIVANTLTVPTLVEGLGSGHKDFAPVVTPDELTLFFSSDREGSKGNGDIWVATRTSTAEPFGNLRILSEINSALQDIPEWVSPDGCRLYYTAFNDPGVPVRVAERPRR